MSLASVLLVPIALMLPEAPLPQSRSDSVELAADKGDLEAPEQSKFSQIGLSHYSFLFDVAQQVRIEQSVRIRIAPHGQSSTQRSRSEAMMSVPQRAITPAYIERKMGRCMPINTIVGVQPSGPHDLVLYLRDRRLIRAHLERECSARDFYSGFYISRSSDGLLCIKRDMLQSRSGMNCKLTEFKQLIESSR